MSKTLLVIHSYDGAAEQMEWSWPYYKLPGWDILGVHAEGGKLKWPDGVPSVGIGPDGRIRGNNLILKLLGTFEILTDRDELDSYTDFCVVEYDGVFLQRPPPHPGALFTHKAVGATLGVQQGFHTPWWVDRNAANSIVEVGYDLLDAGKTFGGSPDIFLGGIVDATGMPWTETNTWSCNGGQLNNSAFNVTPGAIEAVKAGAWYVHGLRKKADLDMLLAARDGR